MKTTFLILGLVVILSGAAVFGRSLVKQPTATSSATPSPSATPDPMIMVDEPKPGAVISSPLKVTGRARGNWFFEASFPVTLKDGNGKIIAQVPAQAKGEWMTTDFVEFEATLIFANPGASVSRSGTLILQKDNASGLPEHDDFREILVFFK